MLAACSLFGGRLRARRPPPASPTVRYSSYYCIYICATINSNSSYFVVILPFHYHYTARPLRFLGVTPSDQTTTWYHEPSNPLRVVRAGLSMSRIKRHPFCTSPRILCGLDTTLIITTPSWLHYPHGLLGNGESANAYIHTGVANADIHTCVCGKVSTRYFQRQHFCCVCLPQFGENWRRKKGSESLFCVTYLV